MVLVGARAVEGGPARAIEDEAVITLISRSRVEMRPEVKRSFLVCNLEFLELIIVCLD